MAGYLPRAVEVPSDLTMAEVEKAVSICMRLELLDNRAGYLIIPPDVAVRVDWKPWVLEKEHGDR